MKLLLTVGYHTIVVDANQFGGISTIIAALEKAPVVERDYQNNKLDVYKITGRVDFQLVRDEDIKIEEEEKEKDKAAAPFERKGESDIPF